MKGFEIAAYTLGGSALVAGSFVLFTGLSGTPLSAIPGIGSFFPQPVAVGGPDGEAAPPMDVREELDGDRRPVGELVERARSPLHAFLLPSPYSAGELAALEQRLEARLREVEIRERELERRECEVAEEREHYRELFAELEELRNGLVREAEENRVRQEEIESERAGLAESERESYRAVAAIYAEGKARDAAGMLAKTYEPDRAALVLCALEDERAAAILAEIHRGDPEAGARYVDAYRRALQTQTPVGK